MFFKNESKQESSKSWLSILITLTISIIFLFLNSLGWVNGFKSGVSYILDPVYETSSSWALEVKEFFTTVTHISEFKNEYNEMKLQITKYEVDNLAFEEIQNENIDLKTQLDLGNTDDRYIQSKVLDHIETEYLILNVGVRDGVKNGDIVVLGDSFVGILIDTGQYSSKVRLPISKSNFLESYILSSKEDSSQRILSRAVVSGSSDGIKIENIGMNSGVENGDTVVVNDSKVGENLILGTVVGLSEDPATTTRTGYVSPVLDYYDLINVFVKIDNDN